MFTIVSNCSRRKLVSPGDLRSYGGGNGLPRVVKQSPEVSRIVEEDEPENDVSILVVKIFGYLLTFILIIGIN